MADYAKLVKEILREEGCSFFRQGKGDHEIWHSPKSQKCFPVDSKIKSRHTANGIMKQAGIDYHF
ncbi:addiction module toxin, HicA family protein [Acetobacter aceti]|uniref:Addiction module toxin, HicA family protein n=1 Tax=Acetobacter aceti TaxID=435 RepID=A0A6S6PN05_ACEAC|nr:addiction module toxin, HicA family protein [Acetobacter aceti]BCI68083.1 addiction module toxin, HicA family protein [Acetobacter aceti]